MNIAPQKKRMILTSVNQILTLIKSNDKLQNLPRFRGLKDKELSTTPSKTCNCARPIKTPDVNKQILEGVLSSLTSKDFQDIKDALGLDELCYYNRSIKTNKLEMICV
jgi:hypothetical protein